MKVTTSGGRGLQEFADRLRRFADDARQLNHTRLTMKISADAEGFVDRECPTCHVRFKIDERHLTAHVGNITCPYDGHVAPEDSWTTREHRNEGLRQTRAFAREWIDAAWHGRGVRRMPARRPGAHVTAELVPAKALDLLKQERTCTKCECRFAFIGAAFFCPLCGDNPAEVAFEQAVASIRRSIAALSDICRDLDRDMASELSRLLLEKHLQDAVTAFQRIGEALYGRMTGKVPPTNAFQRLDGGNDGDSLWTAATGCSYEAYIGRSSMNELRLLFQRRHCLAHCDGMVDQKYLDRTGDTSYAVGQRLRITPTDVTRHVETVVRLVTAMRATAEER